MPDPPAGRNRLLRRLLEREDVAVHPGDTWRRGEPPADVHFHRPGELLVTDDPGQIELFEKVAHDLGIRFHRDEHDPEGPADHDDDLRRTRPVRATRGETGAVRYVVRTRSTLEAVMRRLERGSRHELQVTPNHVLFGCPVWGMEPDGDPRPPQPGQVPSVAPGGAGVAVAVVDTGLPHHFESNFLLEPVRTSAADEEPWGYSGADHVLVSPEGHGSFVAGIVRQTAADAEVLSFRVLDADGVTDEWYLGHQLAVVLASGAQVVNLSLGTSTRADRSLLGLGALAAAASGTVTETGPIVPIVVAAAGNHDDRRPFYPAAESWAIGVGAVAPPKPGKPPVRAPFSNFGSWVDTCALGVDVFSSFEAKPFRSPAVNSPVVDFDGFAVWNGTSFAAPRVSGAVAALLAAHGRLSSTDIVKALAGRPGAVRVPGLGCYVP